ncbi:MAG TPA: gamma-glutamylcyclotransferase [Oceanospirillaceae bacterium]|nr:gamma-glutamylcyclotransferase [Oceanospirillaceae bacterium]
MDKHYIFGYGSLINSDSRRITGIAGDSIPVRVRGLQRYWVSFTGVDMRAVGVRSEASSQCNGVLFDVPAGELDKFDLRERGYVRQALDHHHIEYLDDAMAESLLAHPVWVYTYPDCPRESQFSPISQSYLDVIMLGCLEVGEAFAREFLQHTKLWQDWHDDRLNPRYPRATTHDQQDYLDALIGEVRDELVQRY